MKPFSKGLIFGIALAGLFASIRQDLMGKEHYLRSVDLLWIDTKFSLPVEILLLVLISIAIFFGLSDEIRRSD